MSATAGRSEGGGALAARPAAGTTRATTPAEIAWIALLPCALVALLAILVAGPPLGHLLFDADGSNALWPRGWWESEGTPEPVELGRYVVAVAMPLVLAGVVLALSRRPPRLSAAAIRALVLASQLGVLAFAAMALIAQFAIPRAHDIVNPYGLDHVVVAAAIALAVATVPRSARVRTALVRFGHERPAMRVACAAAATVLAAAWLVEAIDTDRLVEDAGALSWTMDDAFAVMDGHDPLVDLRNIYAKLLPYPAALAMKALGETGFVYTLFMTALSVLAVLAVYAVLRRVSRSSLLALVLFAAFMAQSDLGRSMILIAIWPTRYLGAFVLAWLTARHLDDAWPRRPWALFLVGGLVMVNNLDFGLAAVGGSTAALLCARPPRTWRGAGRLGGGAAAGLLGALALVSLFTLVRAGSLPQSEVLLEWQPIFVELGWFSMAMPTLGLHLAIYLTFAAALVVAVVRLAGGAEDRLLTGMLAWSGAFGLLAGAYFAGRSDYVKLLAMLSAWALALMLLAILCLRALAARGWRAPTVAELLVLFAAALALSTNLELPRPHSAIARLTEPQPPPRYRPAAKAFLLRHARPGDTVTIMLPMAWRLAHELELVNVSPYLFQNAIVTTQQRDRLHEAIERAGVRTVFMPAPGYRVAGEAEASPAHVDALRSMGFEVIEAAPGMLALRRPSG